jgi:hypothetical protein
VHSECRLAGDCVDGYALRCLKGQCRILSLRDANGNHIDTVVIARAGIFGVSVGDKVGDNKLRAAQHFGYKNTSPSDEARTALASLMAQLDRIGCLDWTHHGDPRTIARYEHTRRQWDTKLHKDLTDWFNASRYATPQRGTL